MTGGETATTTDEVKNFGDFYERGWADVSAAERDDLLQQSLTEDCYFRQPSG